MSSVMFSGGVQPVIIVRRRHEIIINLCVSHFGKKIRISRIMDFRILIYSDYYLLWLFLCSDMLLCLLLGTLYVLYIMCFHICNYIILYLWHVSH